MPAAYTYAPRVLKIVSFMPFYFQLTHGLNARCVMPSDSNCVVGDAVHGHVVVVGQRDFAWFLLS